MEKERSLPYPEVTFVFTSHDRRDAGPAWPHISDADVILMEQVGGTPQTRSKHEQLLFMASREESWSKREDLVSMATRYRSFTEEICTWATEEKKEVRFVDVDDSWYGFSWKRKVDLLESIVKDEIDNADYLMAYDYFREKMFNLSVELFERDLVVANQVRQLIDQNIDRWHNKKIAVVQGTHHSPTFYLFRRDWPEIPASGKFTNNEEALFLDHKAFTNIITGSREESESLIKRLFLKEHLIEKAILKSQGYMPVFEISDRADIVIRSFNDDEIGKIFSRLINSGVETRKRKSDLRKNHSEANMALLGKDVLATYCRAHGKLDVLP